MVNSGKPKKPTKPTHKTASPDKQMVELIKKLETRVTADTQALNEKMEFINEKMEFIVEQQAQFAADIQVLRESQADFQKQLKESQAAFDVRLGRLAEATLAAFGKLTAAQQATEERLNIFINVVERYIGKGRNGTS